MSDPQSKPVPDRKIVTIIVSYNTAALVVDAIRSLEPTADRHDNFSTIVVDNKSPGDDVDVLSAAIEENQWHDWVTLIAHDENGGFAAGNNVALRHILAQTEQPEFVYLLNPDAYIEDGAVEELAFFLQDKPECGIVGSKVVNDEGEVQSTAFRFPGIAGEFERAISLGLATRVLKKWQVAPPPRQEAHRTDWVEGSSVMIRKRVFDDIGLFDEGYFLYKEEVDFMLQAARADWQTFYLHKACATHLDGQSTKINECQAGLRPLPKYVFDSWLYYFTRNHGKIYTFAAGLSWLSGEFLYRIHRLMLRRPVERPTNEVSSFVKYCMIPLLWSKTDEQQS